MRYFTSDFHFGSAVLLDKQAMGQDAREFKSLDEMHEALLAACKKLSYSDTLYHLGDFACVGKDRKWVGLDCRARALEFLDFIHANKVLIKGNHDDNNGVPSMADFLVTTIGKWKVTLQHYPSNHAKFVYLKLMKSNFFQINICGHVHSAWKVMYDKHKHILNINVGLDRNNFKIYSESELVNLIERAIRWWKRNDISAHELSYDEWEKAEARDKAEEAREKRIRTLEWLRDNKPELFTPEKASELKSLARAL